MHQQNIAVEIAELRLRKRKERNVSLCDKGFRAQEGGRDNNGRKFVPYVVN